MMYVVKKERMRNMNKKTKENLRLLLILAVGVIISIFIIELAIKNYKPVTEHMKENYKTFIEEMTNYE